MLMRGMRRIPFLALALALWFTAEPFVHSHPLAASSNTPNLCAVCATGVDRPVSAPALAAPLDVIAFVEDAPAVALPASTVIRLASRAPPAA
jgi:hypothetical protein